MFYYVKMWEYGSPAISDASSDFTILICGRMSYCLSVPHDGLAPSGSPLRPLRIISIHSNSIE